MLKAIQNYFSGVGSISKNGSSFNYEISSYKDCYTYILPFLLKYPIPFITKKSYNFEIWKKILGIMISKKHKTEKGSQQIEDLLLKLNKYNTLSKK